VRIGFRDAQRRVVELVGALQPDAGVLLLAREIENHAGVEILEQRIPFRPLQLVDAGDRRLGIARAVLRPSRQQGGHQVGDRSAHRLVDVLLGRGVLLQLQPMHADDEPRDAVVLVDREDAIRELDRLVDIALGERRDEGAVEQLVVFRIRAQRRMVERRSRGGVTFHAGVARGQVAAGRGHRQEVAAGRESRFRRLAGLRLAGLRGLARPVGGLGAQIAGDRNKGECNDGNREAIDKAIETSGLHHGSPDSKEVQKSFTRGSRALQSSVQVVRPGIDNLCIVWQRLSALIRSGRCATTRQWPFWPTIARR
jgi:hypothetical protein